MRARFLVGRFDRGSEEVGTDSGIGSDMALAVADQCERQEKMMNEAPDNPRSWAEKAMSGRKIEPSVSQRSQNTAPEELRKRPLWPP